MQFNWHDFYRRNGNIKNAEQLAKNDVRHLDFVGYVILRGAVFGCGYVVILPRVEGGGTC